MITTSTWAAVACRERATTREGGVTEAPALTGTRTRWHNWAGNEWADVDVVHPASAAEVAELLTTAAATGRRVRPIGSGHSFTAIGRPDDVQLACGGLDDIDEWATTGWSLSAPARRCSG
jgi:FAD/FMN-containing dehydrogenase